MMARHERWQRTGARWLVRAGGALLAVLAVSPARAGPTTSSDIHQVVDNLVLELGSLHAENDTSTQDLDRPVTTKRPRHVVQLARQVLLKVQTLRYINGLAASAIPPLPYNEISPHDVKLYIDLILSDTRGLHDRYGVTGEFSDAALPANRSPTDVYARLLDADVSVQALDLPVVVPNDVYQVAVTATLALIEIHEKLGTGHRVEIAQQSKGKNPGDVYDEAFETYAALRAACARNSEYCVPGNAHVPWRAQGRKITPADVLLVLNNMLAEIVALKVAVGLETSTALAGVQGGKTPSDVFDALLEIHQAIDSLESADVDIETE